MADTKLTGLTADASPTGDDLLYVVNDPAGSPASKKVTVANLLAVSHDHAADEITYTPTVATDWDSDTDPGNVDDALDQLAERVDDLEGGGAGTLSVTTESNGYIGVVLAEETLSGSAGMFSTISSLSLGDYDYLTIEFGGTASSEAEFYIHPNGNTTSDKICAEHTGGTTHSSSKTTKTGFYFLAVRQTFAVANATLFNLHGDGLTYPVLHSLTLNVATSGSTYNQSLYTYWPSSTAITSLSFSSTATIADGSYIKVIGWKESAIVTAVSGTIALLNTDTTDVSNPPTDAELDAAFGTPASVGAGYSVLLDDNSGDSNVYFVTTNGTSWWYAALTKAT